MQQLGLRLVAARDGTEFQDAPEVSRLPNQFGADEVNTQMSTEPKAWLPFITRWADLYPSPDQKVNFGGWTVIGPGMWRDAERRVRSLSPSLGPRSIGGLHTKMLSRTRSIAP